MKNKQHIVRLSILVIVAGAALFAVQQYMAPVGYGDPNGYRAAALNKIAAQPVVHMGIEVCGNCHSDIVELHQKDIHFNVKCEDCHGPGNRHIAYYTGEDETITEEKAAMPKEFTLEGCLFCHRKLLARPRDFPQIDQAAHYKFLNLKSLDTKCIECHSPHEPLFLLTQVKDARIHPVIYECESCHETRPEQDYEEVPDHPVIFSCRDCHAPIVSDFGTQPHRFMRCTACHLFHLENPTAGRIFKNGNRRFCLLCHEKKDFKNTGKQPLFESDKHISEYAEAMDMDIEELRKDPRACLQCHIDSIHNSDLLNQHERSRQ